MTFIYSPERLTNDAIRHNLLNQAFESHYHNLRGNDTPSRIIDYSYVSSSIRDSILASRRDAEETIRRLEEEKSLQKEYEDIERLWEKYDPFEGTHTYVANTAPTGASSNSLQTYYLARAEERILHAQQTGATSLDLSVLNLSATRENVPELSRLLQQLAKLKQLESLNLSMTGFDSTFNSIQAMSKVLGELPELRVLKLYGGNRRKITDVGIANGLSIAIVRLLKQCPKLTRLSLENMDYGNSDSFPILCQGLRHLTKLTHLSLRCNDIGKEGGRRLGYLTEVLSHLSELRKLDLSKNRLAAKRESNIKELANALQHVPKLTDLNLSGNDLTDYHKNWYSKLWRSAPNLTTVKLNDCGFERRKDLHDDKLEDIRYYTKRVSSAINLITTLLRHERKLKNLDLSGNEGMVTAGKYKPWLFRYMLWTCRSHPTLTNLALDTFVRNSVGEYKINWQLVSLQTDINNRETQQRTQGRTVAKKQPAVSQDEFLRRLKVIENHEKYEAEATTPEAREVFRKLVKGHKENLYKPAPEYKNSICLNSREEILQYRADYLKRKAENEAQARNNTAAQG